MVIYLHCYDNNFKVQISPMNLLIKYCFVLQLQLLYSLTNQYVERVIYAHQVIGGLSNEFFSNREYSSIFMSHSLLWRHIVLLTVGVYSSNHRVIYHWNQYDEEISKKCRSIRPSVSLSVCPFVTLTKKSLLLLHY